MRIMWNGSRRTLKKLSLPLVFLAAQLILVNGLQSQTPQTTDNATTLPKFEVVSIRPVKQVDKENCPQGSGAMPSGDTFHINCMPLEFIIKIAYGAFTDGLITGVPDWAKSDFFNIDAKIDPADAPAFSKFKLHEYGLMLQPVLEDRFQLRTHYEPRERTVFALVVASGGPKLKQTTSDPANITPILKMAQWGKIECRNCSIGGLPMLLSQLAGGNQVVDQTGLKGTYDFTLDFNPDPAKADDPRPSIFTALQEQLGLKFVPKKETVNVLVVDHVEQPSPN